MKTFSEMNVVGGGMSPVVGGEGNIQGHHAPKKRKKFAGCEVFELECEEYTKFFSGPRAKYERWSKRLNMEEVENQEIKEYALRNPGKSIVIQDKATGLMTFLKHES